MISNKVLKNSLPLKFGHNIKVLGVTVTITRPQLFIISHNIKDHDETTISTTI